MNIDQSDKLRVEIQNIWFILINAEDCFTYSKYLYLPITESERTLANDFDEIRFIRSTIWSMTIVELSKLFVLSKSHHYNISSFIKKLKPNGEFHSAKINSIIIEEWEGKINSSAVLIEEIQTLRDKFYAHTDRDREKFQNIDLKFADIEDLLKIIKSVVKEIYKTAFDGEPIFMSPSFDYDRIRLINLLVKGKQKHIEEINAEVRNQLGK